MEGKERTERTEKKQSRIITFIQRQRGKLLTEYMLILFLVVFAIAVAFFISDYIVKESAMESSRQSIDVIFGQAQEQIRIFEEDVDNLYNNAVQNGSVTAFFRADNFYERWINLEGFSQVAGNNMRINRNLRNILLYDTEGNLIGNKGDTFVGRKDRALLGGQMTFSDKLTEPRTGTIFFEVGFPVYEEDIQRRYHQVGAVFLLFDVDYMQSIVDGALLNSDSAVAILDGQGSPIVYAGQWVDEYRIYTATQEDEDHLIYVGAIGQNGWKLVGVIPKESMTSDVTMLQQVNIITYLIVLAAMILVCSLIYKRIIQPITRQTAFMAKYTEDTDKRIEVVSNNEIGELARKMNEMLDAIEELNQEVIVSQKKYLELEYAKKQTEIVAYQSQMNPHFLYNTFNCIRGMALYKGEREIAQMTMALSSFFRYSIQGEDIVTVRTVLENLEYYRQIIHYRFNGKYEMKIEAEEDCIEEKLPKMLIQPLVENAVFHGLEPRSGNGTAQVWIRRGEDGLEICVQDNGKGISEENLEGLRQAMAYYDREEAIPNQRYGIGFLNVYRRVRLYYGECARFELESQEGWGTRIRLVLPLEATKRED